MSGCGNVTATWDGGPPPTWEGFAYQFFWCFMSVVGVWAVALLVDLVDGVLWYYTLRTIQDEKELESRFERARVVAMLIRHMDASRSNVARVLDVVDIGAGLAMLAVYVVRTYRGSSWDSVLDYVEGVCAVFFVLDLVLHFITAESGQRAKWARSLPQVLNVLTIAYSVSAVADFYPGQLSLTYLRVILVHERYQRFDAQVLAPSNLLSEVTRHLAVMFFSTLSLVMLFASTVLTLELLGNMQSVAGVETDDGQWTFYRAFYFVFVSISTVGYGDFSAETVFGRFCVVVFIVGGIIFFSIQTGRLVELLREEGAGTGRFVNTSGSLFVVVTGDLTDDLLFAFLQEFYHPDHLGARLNMQAVVLTSDYSLETRRKLRNQPLLRKRVVYLRGSVFSKDDFIRRCSGAHADAVFILTHKFSQDDGPNLLRVLAVKRFVPGLPVYATLNQASNLPLLKAAGVPAESVCRVDELKMGLLAQNTITPGTSTLIANLLGSNNIPDDYAEAFLNGGDVRWHDEYVLGLGQEIYEIDVPGSLVGRTFAEAVIAVYDTSVRFGRGEHVLRAGAALFGIGRLPKSQSHSASGLRTDVLFDVSDPYKLQEGDSLFLLCEDFHILQHSLVHLSETLGTDVDSSDDDVTSSGMQNHLRRHISRRGGAEHRMHKIMKSAASAGAASEASAAPPVAAASLDPFEVDDSSEDDEDEASDLRAELSPEEFARAATDLRRVRKLFGRGAVGDLPLCDAIGAQTGEDFHDGLIDLGDEEDTERKQAAATRERGHSVMSRIRDYLPTSDALPELQPEAPPRTICDHIVVCGGGWTDWIALYLEPLRRSTRRPVVVIDAHDPSAYWAKLQRYEPIYFVQGSAASMFDLVKRARVLHAHRVLILGVRPSAVPGDDISLHMSDSEAAFATLMLENRLSKYNARLTFGTTTEFLVDANVKFLQSSQQIAVAEAVATGNGFWDSVGGVMPGAAMAVQASAPAPPGGREMRRRSTVASPDASGAGGVASPQPRPLTARRSSIALQPMGSSTLHKSMSREASIVGGTTSTKEKAEAVKKWLARLGEEQHYDDVTADQFERSARYAAGKLFGSGSILSVLVQAFYNPCIIHLAHTFAMGKDVSVRHVRIPPRFHGKRYSDLMRALVTHFQIVPLGLFRDKDATKAALQYVFANPPAQTVLYPGDLAFVVVPAGWDDDGAGAVLVEGGELGGAAGDVPPGIPRDGGDDAKASAESAAAGAPVGVPPPVPPMVTPAAPRGPPAPKAKPTAVDEV